MASDLCYIQTLLNKSFDVLCHTGVMECNTGIAICERHIEVLSYVAYVRVRKVLPYGRENCLSPLCHAKEEQVFGTVVHSPDPKKKIFTVPNHDTHISNLLLWQIDVRTRAII
jgi:hypothetical protein